MEHFIPYVVFFLSVFFFFNHSSRSEAREVSLSWIEPDNHKHLRCMAWWVSTQAHTHDWLQARPRTSPAPWLLLKSPWFFSFCIFPVFCLLSSGSSFGSSFAWDPCTCWPLEVTPSCCLCNTSSVCTMFILSAVDIFLIPSATLKLCPFPTFLCCCGDPQDLRMWLDLETDLYGGQHTKIRPGGRT